VRVKIKRVRIFFILNLLWAKFAHIITKNVKLVR